MLDMQISFVGYFYLDSSEISSTKDILNIAKY